jgi:elongation factor Ts
MDIKASEIKDLREKTGAGMMDCKKALVEAKGDFAGAEKLLREWGMAGVEKRAGRATNEGKVFVKEGPGKVSIVEIVCETDFVCRNADFIAAGKKAVESAFAKGYDKPTPELEAQVKDLAAVIKENIALKRVRLVTAGADEYIHAYVHGEGSLAVVVKVKSDKAEAFANERVKAFIHDLALHIAAFNPMFLDQTKPSPTWIQEQKEIFKKQVELDEKMKGKPDKVIDGILAGKLKKLMSEVSLVDQGFVREEKTPVAQAMAAVAKESSCKLEIVDYLYIKVGEA